MYNLLLYSIVLVIVIWTMDGININYIFKKNRIYQARVFYIMLIFSITYLVTDPCCTAKYPLTDMSFNAQPIDMMYHTYAQSGIAYPSPISILLERYPEWFFQYKLGDITLYILCEKKEGANAYFFDEKYFYSLGGYYNQKYK